MHNFIIFAFMRRSGNGTWNFCHHATRDTPGSEGERELADSRGSREFCFQNNLVGVGNSKPTQDNPNSSKNGEFRLRLLLRLFYSPRDLRIRQLDLFHLFHLMFKGNATRLTCGPENQSREKNK